MTFDPKAFAAELGLPDEDRAALLGLFDKHPEVTGKLEGLLTAQVTARLAPLQTELETKQRDLDAQFETLSSIRGGDADAIAKAEARIEKLSSQTAVLQARIRSVAETNGLDAEALLKDIDTPAPAARVPLNRNSLGTRGSGRCA